MKFCYPEIKSTFDSDARKVNTIVIENQRLLRELLQDIHCQINGDSGNAVLSDQDSPLPISRNLELLDCFVPFELNKKALLNKLIGKLAKEAVSEEYYMETRELLGQIESYLMKLSQEVNCTVGFSNITEESLIKSVGVEIPEEYDSLGEKIIDYMELVYELIGKKLFLLYNLRCVMVDEETNMLMKTILDHSFHCIMIENHEYELLEFEKRYIIDKDLCEIS